MFSQHLFFLIGKIILCVSYFPKTSERNLENTHREVLPSFKFNVPVSLQCGMFFVVLFLLVVP